MMGFDEKAMSEKKQIGYMVKHDMMLRILKLLNAVLMTAPFFVAWEDAYFYQTTVPYYFKGSILIIFIYFMLYCIYGRVYEGFMVSIYKVSEIVYSQLLAATISNFFIYIILWLLSKKLPNVVPLLAVFAVQICISILWSNFTQWWYYRNFPPRKSIVVYDYQRDIDKLISSYGLDKKFQVVRTIQINDCLDNIEDAFQDIDTAFLCGLHSHDRNQIMKRCIDKGIRLYILPRIGDVIMSGAKRRHLFHLFVLRIDGYDPSPEFVIFKRLFDILVSLLLLIILSPLLIIVAIIIHATDKGPVFYKQTRLTKGGKEFKIIKFRSMLVDAEKDGVARLSTGEKDDRITPIGHFIRKCRIDEIPQLLNIIRGDMSIVGPRPERPEIAKQYEKTLPEFRLRLQCKAGLTGLAQVYGKYNTEPYDKLQMDLQYISNPGIFEDLRIIFATIKILFMKDSTEGVAEGQTTASWKHEENTEVPAEQDAEK